MTSIISMVCGFKVLIVRTVTVYFGNGSVYIHMIKVNDIFSKINKLLHKKTCLQGPDQIRPKPGCTTTADGYKLEI